MAAPSNITTLNLNGKFTMNKSLCDDVSEILRLQGIGLLTRTAIGMGTAYLTIEHTTDENTGIETIEITQKFSGNIPGSDDVRILDWTETTRDDYIFGPVIVKAKRVQLKDVHNEYLTGKWCSDTERDGVIYSLLEGDTSKGAKKWSVEQVWGFEIVAGKRRYTRRMQMTGPNGEAVRARLAYDYNGPADD